MKYTRYSAAKATKPSGELARRAGRWGLLATLVAGCVTPAAPNDPGARLDPSAIDEALLVTLTGNTHPKADPVYSVGPVADGVVIEHMQLVLKRSPADEAALVAHIDALHDKTSPVYQHWLTAQEFGDQYGVAKADLAVILKWLTSHGLHVDSVPPSRMFIEFSGTAAQVMEAFHTKLVNLAVDGVLHFGNTSDPQIPAELTKVVVGVHSLHNFMPHSMHTAPRKIAWDQKTSRWTHMDEATPDWTYGSPANYVVAPADFATIYNLTPLFAAGITGLNQTVVVLEDTLLANPSDVATFRSAFGLSGYKGTFTQVTPPGPFTCTNAGVNGDEGEAALDAEWAGAAAPDAAIVLAACANQSVTNNTLFGAYLALENLINGTSPPAIVSLSFGECELANTVTANVAYASTYQQAAAEGVSVFVSAGDQGAAACDSDNPNTGIGVATHGIAVSGFASTPYNVAVGGTDFMDTYNNLEGGPALTTYWSTTNTAADGSALSYIPEIPWNDSCAGKLLYTLEGSTQAGFVSAANPGFCNTTTGKRFRTTGAGSGGPSNNATAAGVGWPQPSWQTGVVGLPAKSGGVRVLPDVSLFAASGLWSHFLPYCMSDTAEQGVACTYGAGVPAGLGAGGTSFAAPAMAGIQALINQKMGGVAQGNPNYTYYKLAAAEYGPKGSARCNSSGGTVVSPVLPVGGCIFNDVTQGDIDVNCSGATNCFETTKVGNTTEDGALSVSSTTFTSAFAAGTGWDYATGLGTVNAYNLVNAWSQ